LESVLVKNHYFCSLQDGKILLGLCNIIKPNLVKPEQITENALANATLAINLAETEFGIPRLLDPEDFVQHPDRMANLTYLSYFRTKIEEIEAKEPDVEDEKVEPEVMAVIPEKNN